MTRIRPYLTVFRMRFVLMLQYRAAAVAGFGTQCWWGFIKVMVFAAFFRSSSAHQPMSFAAGCHLRLAGAGVSGAASMAGRSGDRADGGERQYCLRASASARYLLLLVCARDGLDDRAGAAASRDDVRVRLLDRAAVGDGRLAAEIARDARIRRAVFGAMAVTVMLSSAIVMFVNLGCVITLSERGVNSLIVPFILVLSGNIVPLPFFPNWMQPLLFAQPFAGLVDIPFRIYFGGLTGWIAFAGIAQMAAWTLVLGFAGHRALSAAMNRLQVQGG